MDTHSYLCYKWKLIRSIRSTHKVLLHVNPVIYPNIAETNKTHRHTLRNRLLNGHNRTPISFLIGVGVSVRVGKIKQHAHSHSNTPHHTHSLTHAHTRQTHLPTPTAHAHKRTHANEPELNPFVSDRCRCQQRHSRHLCSNLKQKIFFSFFLPALFFPPSLDLRWWKVNDFRRSGICRSGISRRISWLPKLRLYWLNNLELFKRN